MENYEQKYKEALKRAKDLHDNHPYGEPPVWITCEKIFPELKESDDERIRKGLIEHLKELKEQSVEGSHLKRPEHYDAWIAWLEKQGKQNPADKVEPKFKIEKGKWYVCIRNLYDNYANKAFCEGDTYLSTQDGNLIPCNSNVPYKVVCPDTYFRDWTIQDAKDGDVLADKDRAILLFRGIGNEEYEDVIDFYALLEINMDNRFSVQKENEYWDKTNNCNLKPAPKKQRDLLFQKMKEAGYEWDAEKKELKKIKQKPAWSEEDEKELKVIISELKKYVMLNQYGTPLSVCDISWLEELPSKFAIQIQPKQEWSKEDEEMFDAIIADIQFTQKCHNHEVNQVVYEREIDWLKSIKPNHWKPSEEEMIDLYYAAKQFSVTRPSLKTLYEHLKTL